MRKAPTVIRRAAPFRILATALVAAALAACGAGAPPVDPLTVDGPHAVRSYDDAPVVAGVARATIYYPADVTTPVAGVAVAPEFDEGPEGVAWWGPRLASHGYATLVLDPANRRAQPAIRGLALLAAIEILRSENGRTGSPLQGRLDPDRMAVVGQSMGGAGALIAGRSAPGRLRAVVATTPWEPDATLDRLTVPTLIVAGASDTMAPVEQHAWRQFGSIPSTTPRAYVEITGGDHFVGDTTRGHDLGTVSRLALAWLKCYLDGDRAYRQVFVATRPEGDTTRFTRFLSFE